MALTPTNISSLLWPGIRKIFGDEYAQYPEQYSKVFTVDSSTMNYEKDQGITSLGLAAVKPVCESISYDTFNEGFSKTYTHVTYGLGIAIGRETLEDALYRNIRNMPRAQARSVRHTIEILGANVLNNAFTASAAYYGGDGVELCSLLHPTYGGGGYVANELATPADLDIDSFEQALIDIQSFVDDRGLKIAIKPKLLVIPPNLEFTAKQLLKSEKLPGSAYNDINPAQGMIPYTVMNWLTDTDAWFIVTDCPNGLTFLWRRRPEYKEDNNFDAEVAKFKATFRCSMGWTDARGIFGSPGA